ncbi:MAG: type II toxin-antitoxin system VapC family toxin [Planctomycetia bacterium]|nr:type II toxin-antitoxin system VapC family toxin [Planctomycetia bacterium]
MSFLLDTNILSAHLRRPSGLAHRFVQHSGRLYTSTICLAELYAWANGRADPVASRATIDRMLHYEVAVVDFDHECAREFGRLRFMLRKQGTTVSSADLMIAATALLYDFTLVTHNVVHFQPVPDLRIADWLEP